MMKRVLYVEASPRKERSASIEVARALLDALPGEWIIDTLDVWSEPLPEFNDSTLAAKYAGLSGTPLTADQALAWESIQALTQRFHDADLLVFALPLWNWSIPYKLKHLIDVISQKDLLFSFDARGFGGLLTGKKAVVIYARGIDFSPSSTTPADRFDFQRPYMEAWLKFIGVTEIESIIVQKTLFGPEVDQGARAGGKRQAQELAQELDRRISSPSNR